MTGPIHHIALLDEWVAATTAGEYRRSTRERSLDEEGFIHCSTPDQWEATYERFYVDCDEPLVLLTIDPTLVPCDIRVEDGFPHIYGPLPTAAVTEVESLD